MEDAVRQSVGTVADADLAAVELAAAYAVELDSGGDVDKVGPLLLAALESLLLTPRSRSAKGGGRDDKPGNPLDELRARRGARVGNAPPVDSATS